MSQIGAGGMGVVYLAKHTMLGKSAVVKVLLPELSQNREIVNRFFNEARAATAVQHPGIVEIYDFGYLADGDAYIIMEFLQGESLATRIKRIGRLPAAQALLLVRQIAGALHAAHQQQIIHRDLKPDNIFVIRDPEIVGGERIKLLDFGIAKLASEISDGTRTRTGAVIGTPTYMAPEQCRGAGAVDARADLYALGCILYELLCGRPPFVSEAPGEIIAHHLYFTPESPGSSEPSVPADVEQLVMRLLQKAPAARPRSAAEVVAAIDQVSRATTGPSPSLASLASHVSSPIVAMPTTLNGTASQVAPSVRTASRPQSRRWIPAIAGCVLAAAGILVALRHKAGQVDEVPMSPASKSVAVDEIAAGFPPAPRDERPASTPPVPEPARGPLTLDAGAGTLLADASPVAKTMIPAIARPAPTRKGDALPEDIKSLNSECLRLQTAHEWGALINCAKRLHKLAPKSDTEKYIALGRDEQDNESAAARAMDRIRKGYLKDALALIAKIEQTSAYYKPIQDALTKAEDEVIQEGVRAAETYSASGDCAGLKRYKQQFALRTPRVVSAISEVGCLPKQAQDKEEPFKAVEPVVDDKEQARSKVAPAQRGKLACAGIDVEITVNQAAAQYKRGFAADALKLMIQALNCEQNVTMLRLAAMYACAAGDINSAKLLLPKVPTQFRPVIIQRCEQEHVRLP